MFDISYYNWGALGLSFFIIDGLIIALIIYLFLTGRIVVNFGNKEPKEPKVYAWDGVPESLRGVYMVNTLLDTLKRMERYSPELRGKSFIRGIIHRINNWRKEPGNE